jgi:hypothetical protein
MRAVFCSGKAAQTVDIKEFSGAKRLGGQGG